MESVPEPKNKSECKHYQKINIFGEAGVGKSSLISHMENFDNDNYKIKNSLEGSKMSQESNYESLLVEQIKRIKIAINEDNPLFLNLYETNLDNYDFIKMNLDILLLQTECIIIMWDKSKNDSFDNISNFFFTINQGIKENKFRNVPIFLVQNKKDFEIVSSEGESGNNINHSIEEMKKENNDIVFREISLLEKEDFFNLILDINRNLSNYKKEKRLNNDIVNYVKFNENIVDMTKFRKKDIIVLKGILLGHTNVGKTTFFRYIQRKEYNGFLSTIGIDSLTINAEVNKENILFELFDTAGQERYESISKNYYKQVDGILFFFDVTNEESFKRIDKWIKNIEESENMNNFEMILIGNKIDKSEERKISKKEAKEKANKYGMKYFESCCLIGLNIYELLNEIIFSAYNKYYEKESRGIKKRNSNTLKSSINVKKESKSKRCC